MTQDCLETRMHNSFRTARGNAAAPARIRGSSVRSPSRRSIGESTPSARDRARKWKAASRQRSGVMLAGRQPLAHFTGYRDVVTTLTLSFMNRSPALLPPDRVAASRGDLLRVTCRADRFPRERGGTQFRPDGLTSLVEGFECRQSRRHEPVSSRAGPEVTESRNGTCSD